MVFETFQSWIVDRKTTPELPDTKDKLREILEKSKSRLKIVSIQGSTEIGTTVESAVLLECPFCKSKFTGQESSGCFHGYVEPHQCPICGFPNNVINKLYEIIAREKLEKEMKGLKWQNG